MPDVVVRKCPEEPATLLEHAGELEVDERRFAAIADEDVRFLGKIVVNDAGAVQATPQVCRAAKKIRPGCPCVLQRAAFDEAAREPVLIHRFERRYAGDAFECQQRTRLAAHQRPREPAEPGRCRARITHDQQTTGTAFGPNFAKQVLFE